MSRWDKPLDRDNVSKCFISETAVGTTPEAGTSKELVSLRTMQHETANPHCAPRKKKCEYATVETMMTRTSDVTTIMTSGGITVGSESRVRVYAQALHHCPIDFTFRNGCRSLG